MTAQNTITLPLLRGRRIGGYWDGWLLMGIVALAPFPHDHLWLREVLVVQAAMPAGVFAIVIVKSYDGDTEIALRIILATLAGCLITMPAWLSLRLKMLSP